MIGLGRAFCSLIKSLPSSPAVVTSSVLQELLGELKLDEALLMELSTASDGLGMSRQSRFWYRGFRPTRLRCRSCLVY